MKRFFSMMLIVATLFSLSCSKDDDGGSSSDGAYVGTYKITGVVTGASASGDMSLDIDVKSKLATVTMRGVAFHEDMTPLDVVLPNIPYDESYSSSGMYGFTSDAVSAQTVSGEVISSSLAKITNVVVQTNYTYAYLKFACDVADYEMYLFEFSNYEY